jgi:hypothetical protein
VRRGAASCRVVLGSCPVAAAVRAAAPVPSRGAVLGGRAPSGAVTRARSGRLAVVAGREDVRTPARPVVVVSASSGPRWGRPSSRSSGRPASACPVSRRPMFRRPVQPSVRTDRPRCPRAAALSAPRWTAKWFGVAGRSGRARWVDVAPWSASGVVACRHRAGREGMVRRWPWLARMRLTVARAAAGRRPAAAPWPQRADRGAGPGPGCRPGGGEHGME